MNRGAASIAVAAALALAMANLASPGPAAPPPWRFPAPAPATVPTTASGNVSDGATAAVSGGAVTEADGDEGVDPTAVHLSPNDGRIQVYTDAPSILPGQALRLHTSTTARSYSITIYRESTRQVKVFSHSGYRGHNYRVKRTLDATTDSVRANWPVTVSIPTRGWQPGVYTLSARDSSGRASGTVFVVRSPSISPSSALFVLPVLTYEAYNSWGGFDLYTTPRATEVSFDRPYDVNAGLSYYPTYDRYTLRWLIRHGYPLSFTTDYDLATSPPDTAPRVLVIPQHAEYVTKSLFDWVDAHVNTAGDMNVASFGANLFYWQVRLVPGPAGSSRTSEVVCYKSRSDPIAATDPTLTTVRWRDGPVSRPEKLLFGAMYSGIVDGGHVRHDAFVTDAMPDWALAGTGWSVGTRLRGLLLGEADMTHPETGGIAMTVGTAPYQSAGVDLVGNMSIRTSAAGGRIFDAGTFLYGGVLGNRDSVGVPYASFDRFTRNIMSWLGLDAPH